MPETVASLSTIQLPGISHIHLKEVTRQRHSRLAGASGPSGPRKFVRTGVSYTGTFKGYTLETFRMDNVDGLNGRMQVKYAGGNVENYNVEIDSITDAIDYDGRRDDGVPVSGTWRGSKV